MSRWKWWCALLASALLASMAVAVPAAGGASPEVAADRPGEVTIGHPDSWLVTSAGGDRAAVAAEVPRYDVRVSLLNRAGVPATGESDSVGLMSHDSGEWIRARHGELVSLPAGEYHAVALVLTPRPGQQEPSVTMLIRHRFRVRGDTSISFDARTAQPAGARVDRPDARHTHLTVGGSFLGDATSAPGGYSVNLPENYDQLYLDGFQAAVPGFLFYLRERFIAIDAQLVAERPERFEVPVWWAPRSPRLDGTVVAGLVDGGAGRPADLAGVDARGKAVLVTPADGDDYGEAARVVAAAGGRAIVMRLLPGVHVGNDANTRTAVPVLYTTRSAADRLATTTRVRLSGLRNSPYVYELAVPLSGTGDASPQARDRDLARIDASYAVPAVPVQDAHVFQWTKLGPFWTLIAGFCCEPLALPHRRTEYYSPATWFAWYSAGAGSETEYDVHHLVGPTRELAPGDRLTEIWGAPVLGPAVAGTSGRDPNGPTRWAYRDGDTLQLSVPLLADGDGHASTPDVDQVESATGGTTLYRDGEVIGSTDQPGNGVFTVPPGPADLRLVTEFHRPDRDWWPTSTSVHVDWRVRSTGDGVLPLLAVRFRPDADLSGLVRPGRALPVWVERHAGAPAAETTELAIEVSYDDGASWLPATLRRSGDAWTAQLPAGPRDGFVSLRASATDTAGNAVEQTIIRAYRVGRS